MTPYDQLNVGPNVRGDCWRTCIACLLDIPPVEVPHFGEEAMDTGEFFMTITNRWLEPRGLRLNVDAYAPQCLAIATGQSPRNALKGHSVIIDGTLTDEDGKPKIIHDPHPSRSGLGSRETIFWLVPL